MWKKLGSSASIPVDSSPDSISSESVGEMLMSAIRESSVAKEQLIRHSQDDSAQSREQTLHPLLREYTETVEKCTTSASEFIRCASLLSEARDAYENLRTLRGEIKRVLADDEEKLSALMDQVQKTADTQLPDESAQSISERKGPESSKIAPISAANGERSKMMKFP